MDFRRLLASGLTLFTATLAATTSAQTPAPLPRSTKTVPQPALAARIFRMPKPVPLKMIPRSLSSAQLAALMARQKELAAARGAQGQATADIRVVSLEVWAQDNAKPPALDAATEVVVTLENLVDQQLQQQFEVACTGSPAQGAGAPVTAVATVPASLAAYALGSATLVFPASTLFGASKIECMVDSSNQVLELDEGNNAMNLTATLAPKLAALRWDIEITGLSALYGRYGAESYAVYDVNLRYAGNQTVSSREAIVDCTQQAFDKARGDWVTVNGNGSVPMTTGTIAKSVVAIRTGNTYHKPAVVPSPVQATCTVSVVRENKGTSFAEMQKQARQTWFKSGPFTAAVANTAYVPPPPPSRDAKTVSLAVYGSQNNALALSSTGNTWAWVAIAAERVGNTETNVQLLPAGAAWQLQCQALRGGTVAATQSTAGPATVAANGIGYGMHTLVKINLGRLQAGSYNATCTIDPTNALTDPNRTNNAITSAFTIP